MIIKHMECTYTVVIIHNLVSGACPWERPLWLVANTTGRLHVLSKAHNQPILCTHTTTSYLQSNGNIAVYHYSTVRTSPHCERGVS